MYLQGKIDVVIMVIICVLFQYVMDGFIFYFLGFNINCNVFKVIYVVFMKVFVVEIVFKFVKCFVWFNIKVRELIGDM